MLVNIQDIPLNNIKDIPQFHIPELQLDLNLDVNRNVIGVTFSNDKFVTGGVHACNSYCPRMSTACNIVTDY